MSLSATFCVIWNMSRFQNLARALLESGEGWRRRSSSPYLASIRLVVAPCQPSPASAHRRAGGFENGSFDPTTVTEPAYGHRATPLRLTGAGRTLSESCGGRGRMGLSIIESDRSESVCAVPRAPFQRRPKLKNGPGWPRIFIRGWGGLLRSSSRTGGTRQNRR